MNPFAGRSCGAGKWIAGGVAAAAAIYLYRSATTQCQDPGPSSPRPAPDSEAAPRPSQPAPASTQAGDQPSQSTEHVSSDEVSVERVIRVDRELAGDDPEEEAPDDEDPALALALADAARGCGEWLEEHCELVREMDFEWLHGESMAELVEQHVLSPLELSRVAYFLSAFTPSGQLVLSQEPGSIDQRWLADCERWWMQSLQLLGLVLGREQAREPAHPLSASSSWIDADSSAAAPPPSASASALDASWSELSHPSIAFCLYSKGRKLTPSQISAVCRDCEQVLSVPGAFDYEWVVASVFKGCALLCRPSLRTDLFQSLINVTARAREPDLERGDRTGLSKDASSDKLFFTDPYNLDEDQLSQLQARFPPSAGGFYGQFLRDCLLASCREFVRCVQAADAKVASSSASIAYHDRSAFSSPLSVLVELDRRARQYGEEEALGQLGEEKEDRYPAVWRDLGAMLPRGLVWEAVREARSETELTVSKWSATARADYAAWRASAGAKAPVDGSEPSTWAPFCRALEAESLTMESSRALEILGGGDRRGQRRGKGSTRRAADSS